MSPINLQTNPKVNVRATAFEVVDNRFLESNAAGATAKVLEEPEVDTTDS